jgi:hypothetical protein
MMQHEACPMSETSIRKIFGKFYAIRKIINTNASVHLHKTKQAIRK